MSVLPQRVVQAAYAVVAEYIELEYNKYEECGGSLTQRGPATEPRAKRGAHPLDYESTQCKNSIFK